MSVYQFKANYPQHTTHNLGFIHLNPTISAKPVKIFPKKIQAKEYFYESVVVDMQKIGEHKMLKAEYEMLHIWYHYIMHSLAHSEYMFFEQEKLCGKCTKGHLCLVPIKVDQGASWLDMELVHSVLTYVQAECKH